MFAAEIASMFSEFDIFAHKPVQTSVLGTIETAYKPIAPSIKMIWNFKHMPTRKTTHVSISNSTSEAN